MPWCLQKQETGHWRKTLASTRQDNRKFMVLWGGSKDGRKEKNKREIGNERVSWGKVPKSPWRILEWL